MKTSEVTKEQIKDLVEFLEDLLEYNKDLDKQGDKFANDCVHALEYELMGLKHKNEHTQQLTYVRCYEDYDLA